MSFEFTQNGRVRLKSGGQVKDLTGQTFGRLTVLARAENHGGRVKWCCKCECGNQKAVKAANLLAGCTNSCGCLAIEAKRARALDNMSKSPEKQAWYKMLRRCHDSEHYGYSNYGARGIVVCPRWRDSFLAFYEDMGPRPSAKYSIDRIDNDKGYEPTNCRWATQAQQNGNQRRSRIMEFQGRMQCIAHWAKEHGIAVERVYSRMKAGWDFPTALTTPIDASKVHRSKK